MECKNNLKFFSETYFYTPPEHIHDNTLSVTGSEMNHVRRVLRCGVGDQITVVDGCGREYHVSLERILKERIECRILHSREKPREPAVSITLGQACCRASKFDLVVEKTTELGVQSIIPVITEKSMKLLRKDRIERRVQRWQKIAVAAMKQSKRSILPHVSPPSMFDTILSLKPDYELCLIANEGEKEQGLRDVLKNVGKIGRALVVVGPESGLSEGEIEQALATGFLPFSMGQRRLRTETAGILAVSLLLYELGELGG